MKLDDEVDLTDPVRFKGWASRVRALFKDLLFLRELYPVDGSGNPDPLQTLDFPSISAQSHQDLTVTVTGAEEYDKVLISPPSSITAGVNYLGFISADDTVTVRAINYTSGAIDPASAVFRVTVLKY